MFNGLTCVFIQLRLGAVVLLVLGKSVSKFLTDIGVAPRARRSVIRRQQEAPESASTWIRRRRDGSKRSN